MDHSYLWQTVLWVRENGGFAAYPEPGTEVLRTLKTGLMVPDPYAPAIQNATGQANVTRIEAATAYLALVIRYVGGWLAANRPMLFSSRKTNWSVNVGLPAASYDDESLVHRYRKAAVAALKLAHSGKTVNVEGVRRWLRDDEVREAATSEEHAGAIGVTVIPETAAEATGFAKSTATSPGLYLMVDVGAMTMDICTFRLNVSQEGGEQYALFYADVRPFGVEAYH